MDNGLTIVAPAPFVVNVVQVTGGSAGFAISAGVTAFSVVISTSSSGGALGEEFTLTEKDKLANIEPLAKDDLTGSEIKALYEGENNTNEFNDAEKTKLATIETSAKDDLTGAEIKILYEAELDTNAFTDAEQTKMAGIESGAAQDQDGAEIKILYEAETDTNAFLDAEKSKLTAIEASATADQSDTEITAAYGNQVPKITTPEIAAATEAAVRRFSPVDVKAMVLAHETGGGGGDMTDQEIEDAYNRQVAKISGSEITAGTEAAVRRVSPADLKAIVLAHETGGGGMTDAEVKTAYENNPDTNVHTDAQVTKLDGIETTAKDDQTGAEIKSLYQAEANAFTDTKNTKLAGIETAATADQSDGEIATAYGNVVGQISAGEITAGTETALRTSSPADLKAMVDTHGGGGGGGGSGNPMSGARVEKTGSQSIPNATATIVTFDTERFDDEGYHSNTVNNSRLTAPADDKYLIVAGIDTAAISGAVTVQLYILLNGEAAPGQAFVTNTPDNSSAGSRAFTMSTIIEMTAGQYVELSVYHNFGSSKNLDGVPSTFFSIIRLTNSYGPVDLNPQVNDYTLALTDAEDIVEMNKATANVLTIPTNTTVAFPVGTVISVSMMGVGITTITAAATVTLNGVSAGSGAMTGQFAGVSLYKSETDVWVAQGAIETVA